MLTIQAGSSLLMVDLSVSSVVGGSGHGGGCLGRDGWWRGINGQKSGRRKTFSLGRKKEEGRRKSKNFEKQKKKNKAGERHKTHALPCHPSLPHLPPLTFRPHYCPTYHHHTYSPTFL